MFKEIAIFTDVVITLFMMFGAMWVWFTYVFTKQQYGTTGAQFIKRMEESIALFVYNVGWLPVITWTVLGAFFGITTYYDSYFSVVMLAILVSVIVPMVAVNRMVNHLGGVMA